MHNGADGRVSCWHRADIIACVARYVTLRRRRYGADTANIDAFGLRWYLQ